MAKAKEDIAMRTVPSLGMLSQFCEPQTVCAARFCVDLLRVRRMRALRDTMGARETWYSIGRLKGERKGYRWRRLKEEAGRWLGPSSFTFMKVRAAAWYQGWGKGQACEQMNGENVSSSCYRRQTERTKGAMKEFRKC